MKAIVIFILGMVAGAYLHHHSIISANDIVTVSNSAADKTTEFVKDVTKEVKQKAKPKKGEE